MNRIAYREYTRYPDLADADFRLALGKELFGSAATSEAVEDALVLQRILAAGRTWCLAAPPADPDRLGALVAAGQLSQQQRTEYREAVERVRRIAARYQGVEPPLAELHRIATWIAGRWAGETGRLLEPSADAK